MLDNLSSGNEDFLPDDDDVEFVQGDVCDDRLVGELVHECDHVVHLAAGLGVGRIVERPTGSLRQGLIGTEIVARHAAVQRRPLFFASTSEVYGDSEGEALDEDRCVGFGSPDRVRFTYAAGKTAGEALVFAYAHEYGLLATVGRFFNVTGPCQEDAVVPRFVDQALAGGPLRVHDDGGQTRSFLDVRDAAEYVWRLLPASPRGGLLVNIGRDAPVTILELAQRVRDLVDRRVEIAHEPPAYGEGFVPIRYRRPDTKRLVACTGYEPQHSLNDTLRTCISYRRAEHTPR